MGSCSLSNAHWLARPYITDDLNSMNYRGSISASYNYFQQGRKTSELNRELILELRQQKKIYDLWKQGLALQGDYRAAFCMCRVKTIKANTQFELTLATVASDNKNKKASSKSPARRGKGKHWTFI